MKKKEAIPMSSVLVPAFLLTPAILLSIGLEKNTFFLALIPVILSLAVFLGLSRKEGGFDPARILQYKKWLGILAIIILISIILLVLPKSIIRSVLNEMVNYGPQYITNGIVIGSILSLGAIGLTTVYKILGFPNFAHGDFLTFGAYMVLLLNPSFDFSLILSIIGAIGLGILLVTTMEKILWKPLREKGAGNITMLIASIGLALFLRNLILFIFGGSTRNYFSTVFQGLNIAGVTITILDIMVVIISIFLMFLVYFLLTRTKMGKSMRALSDNKNLAKVSGINVDRVILFTWIIGISLAVIAGFSYGLVTNVSPNMGWTLLLPLFAAVILGGIGNPYGAMIGGLVVGISQEFSLIFIPPEYKPAVSFVLIIILLLWKPTGLMGD